MKVSPVVPGVAPAPAQSAKGEYARSISAKMEASKADLDIDTQETGELFEYKIAKPVSVPRDSSSLIPIVQSTVDGERVSLYKERAK